jgi:D-threo-aldose 1-dehydrogenase
VTRLGFGAAPIGGLYEEVGDDVAQRTVDAAWDVGIRFFDTAPLYGLGNSEHRLGRALAARPRTELVVATKVGRLLRPGIQADPTWQGAPDLHSVFDFSYDGALRSLEESLERLGLDRVDIVHIHDPDDHVDAALAGAYRALLRLRDEGVVGAIGVGMNQWQALLRFARVGDFDCFLLAGRFTLLDQSAADEFLPLCVDRKIAVLAAGVFNSGILADPHASSPMYDYAPAAPEVVERARRLDAVCRRHGVPLKAAALQFAGSHPAIASVLVGARSPKEIAENAELLDVPIPIELWDELRAAQRP